MQMIDDVGNQKRNRSRERGQLTPSMRQDAPAANEIITAAQQDETRSVKGGVKVREKGIKVVGQSGLLPFCFLHLRDHAVYVGRQGSTFGIF